MTTTDHLNELHSAIITALQADEELAGLINGVYSKAPLDARYPFVTVDNLTAAQISTHTTSGWNIKLAIKAFSRERDSDEASGIIAQVRRIILAASLELEHGSITTISESGSGITCLADGVTFLRSINFNVILQQGSDAFIASGDNFIIKIGDGGSPVETFTEIGGLRNASVNIANKVISNSNLATGRWQSLVGSLAGVALKGVGFFTDSVAEETLRSLAFSANLNNYQIMIGNNQLISGAFIVSSYKRLGNIEAPEATEIALESSGEVTFGDV